MTVTENKKRANVPESLEGIKVIDVDTHLTEPADLWTSRAPQKYKDQVPRVMRRGTHEVLTPKGEAMEGNADQYVWVVGDNVMGYAGGASVINHDNVKVKGAGFRHWPLTEASPAASFIEPRLDLMDEVGIWGQIIYPNVVGFGGQAFSMIEDVELRNACAQIWNDAMIEMYEQSGGRLNGMATIPWWDIEGSVREIRRVHRQGLKGINLTSDPQNHGLPDLAEPAWEPLWEVCEELDMPINFHIGASQTQMSWFGTATWPSLNDDIKLALGSSVLYLGNARVIGNLIYSGLLERHPTLKFVSAESGLGWIPFMLEALDYQADENNVSGLSMKPSEYFYRNMWSCFWFEGQGGRLLEDIDRVGWKNAMYETDFPHPTCLYPEPLKGIGQTLAAVDYEKRRQVLSSNAAELYNITIPD
jgi:predicted TIM-barrel fold metal-dependent hydrolase